MAAGQISLNVIAPIGLSYIASTLLKDKHEVHVIDSVGENISQFTPFTPYKSVLAHGLKVEEIVDRINSRTELIGISTMFSHEWPLTKEIIQRIHRRFPRVPIILGGEHATALSEYILNTTPEIECCVLGEGEETITDLAKSPSVNLAEMQGITYRSEGEIINKGLRPRIRKIDELPFPAWELFPVSNYLDNGLCSGVFRGRSMPILFSRGCPYECAFCSNSRMWGRRWIPRDPANVVAEIKKMIATYRVENFECCDPTAIVRKDWILKFANLLIENHLNIAWQFPSGTRTEVIDAEICDLLYRSGCKNLAYAPESGSTTVLHRVKKRVDLAKTKESIRAAVRAGIKVRVNLVLGFPEDTHKDIWQTFKFIFELAFIGIHDMTHFIFIPYPGSLLFEQLRASGKIQELDGQYFLNLLSMTDIKKTPSFARFISASQLTFYRIFSLVWFYSLLLFFRPWRLYLIARNVLREKQESRMEMAIKNIVFWKKSTLSAIR